jgi:hypothetical protein
VDLAAGRPGGAVAHPWAAHRDRPDAGLDLALRQVAVAHDPPAAGRVRQMPVRLDERRHLGLNRLHQQLPRAGTQNLRQ